MEKKVILTYRKGDILNGCRLNLTKELVNILMLTEEKRELIFEYKDETIFLMATTTEIEEIKNIENGEIKYLKTIIKAGYEKGKNNYKLSIPLQIAKAMQLDKIPMVVVDIKNNIIEIKKSTQKIESLKKEKKINKNGKIYMITVKKGGSAKTFTAIQIAYFLAVIKRSKVLLISSDTSNDHLFNLLTVEEAQELSKNNNVSIDKTGKITIKKGLKHLVLSEKIDYSDYTIEARENLDVIPLENDIFRLTTAEEFTDYQNYMLRFPKVMKKLRNLYD